MTGLVEVDVTEDGIGMMTIQPPPAGAPETAVRSEIAAALDDLMAREDLRGLVLRAPGRRFADGIAPEADSPAQAAPTLADLCARLEGCPVPVVVAIHGVASGAGLEFAMAADYRVAGPQAHFALPGIAVGMLPVAGATQRLPRLVGVPAALEILLAGKSFAPTEAARLGLIDRAVAEAPGQAALGLLRALTAEGADGLRPTSARMDRMTDYARNASAVASARHKAASQPGPAAARIVDCVEAAFMLPFEAGVYYESTARDEVARSPQTRALRHLRQAQQRAAPVTGDAAAHVAIAGGGEEAAKLAVRALDAGLKVTVAAPTESGRDGTQEMIVRLYHLAEAEGRVSERGLADRIARLELATGLERLVRAEVVFVPLPTGAEAAKKALAPVAQAAAARAALMLLAPGHRVSALAQDVPGAERLVRASFAGDPLLAQLAELAPGADTDPVLLDRCDLLARRMGLSVVRRADSVGTLCDKVALAGVHAADFMLAQGASPYQVDDALRAYGFAEGPYERIDTQGLDRASTGPGLLGQALMADARMGRAAARGYYSYDRGDGTGTPDPVVLNHLQAVWDELGIRRRSFSDDEIVQRFMTAMANAGARAIESGMVASPGDVDLAITGGYGLARWRGGPMFQADQTGLLSVKQTLEALVDEDPDFWAPAPLFAEMIKNGRRFTGAG